MAIRALVADGSRQVRGDVRQYLECIGCDVLVEAETAAQTLPLFRTVRPAIVTLGIALPYGGQPHPADLVRLVKREAPQTSILMIGTADPAEECLFVDEGALECFLHPIDCANLEHLWRALSQIYPELRSNGFGARRSNLRLKQTPLAPSGTRLSFPSRA